MKRTLEKEAMDSLEETVAYDRLVSDKQGDILDECFALSVLNLGISEGKILDIGTGTGRIPIKIVNKQSSFQVVGIDLSENMLQVAKENREQICSHPDHIEFQYADAKNLPYEDDYFDVVMSHVTLHHLEDPLPVLKEANRVLNRGGDF